MSDNQIKLDTEEYDVNRIVAGKLDDKGIVFALMGQETLTGKYGEFHRILCKANPDKANEYEFVLDYSSGKLHTLLSKNWDLVYGQVVRIVGRGKDYDRNYSVFVIDKPADQSQDVGKLRELVRASQAKEA
jgi:hypothetical protein